MEAIVERLDGDTPTQVSFVNADCVNIACRNPEYLEALQQSDLVFADGIGVRLAGDVLGQPVRDNVNGTDLFPCLAAALQGTGKRIYLLGGRPGVAEGVARWLAKNYPGVEVAGWRHGYFSAEDEAKVIEDIRRCGADLVLVAFGALRQELWIRRNLSKLGAKVVIGRRRTLGFLLRPHSPGPALGPQAGHGMVLSSLPGAQAAVAAIPCRQRRLPGAIGAYVLITLRRDEESGVGWDEGRGELGGTSQTGPLRDRSPTKTPVPLSHPTLLRRDEKNHHAERDEYGYFCTSSFTTAYEVAWAPPISVSIWIVFTTLPISAPATNVTGTTWTDLESPGGCGDLERGLVAGDRLDAERLVGPYHQRFGHLLPGVHDAQKQVGGTDDHVGPHLPFNLHGDLAHAGSLVVRMA